MAKPRAKAPDESFEKLFAELEAVVAKLESGSLALDEALALYERGTELAKRCAKMLDQAELRIKEIEPVGPETELEDSEDEEEDD